MPHCIEPGRLSRVLLVSMDVAGHYSLATPLLKGYAEADPDLARNVKLRLQSVLIAGRGTRMLRSILGEIFSFRPQVVAFSCNIWNARHVQACSRWVRRLFPRTIIILGGQEICEPIVEIQQLYPAADILVPGEGEGPFRSLLKALLQRGIDGLGQVSGIHFYGPDGNWHYTGPNHRILELDSIPSAYLSGNAQLPPSPRMGAMIEVSRGCPLRCSFCFESERYPTAKSFSMERVAEEFKYLRKLGHQRFHILDPILCLGDRISRLHEALADVDLKDASVSAEIYAEYLKAEEVPKMDFVTVCDIGLQTVSSAASLNIKRTFKRERFEAGFRYLKEGGKRTNIYLLSGLPGDTLQSFMAGVDYVTRLGPDQIFLNPLLCLRGTGLRIEASKHGLRYHAEPPYLVTACDTFPEADLAKARSYSRMMDRHYNRVLSSPQAALSLSDTVSVPAS